MFTKILRIGKVADLPRHPDLFVKIEVRDSADGPVLSITGVVGPKRNGDAIGSCGQCVDSLADVDAFAPGWDADKAAELRSVWERWHLNNMRAGCEHQRADGWDARPIDPSKPTRAYGRHFPGQRSDSWNMLTWVRRDEHPDGLLSHPCPTCGYRYGTAWLHESLPADVVDWLRNLPDADIAPAWC